MNASLNPIDINLLTDITQIAVQNIANALHGLLRDEIVVKNWLFDSTAIQKALESSQIYPPTAEQTVLYTQIVGELKGNTYLIVPAAAEDKICEKLLPASVLGQSEMREGVLLEMDNIIIAALVTKFANLLSISDVHGYVPNYHKKTPVSISEELKAQSIAYSFMVEMKAFKKDVSFTLIVSIDNSLLTLIESFNRDNSFVGKEKEGEDSSSKGVSKMFKKLFQI